MITPATQVARNPGVLGEAVLGETVILDPEADRFFRLNRSGEVLWARLPATVADLAAELAARFGLDEARALADTTAVVEKLAARGLVTLG